jgi:hypothetical protein
MKNYRRMNHLLALLAFLVMMLVIPALTFGDQLAVGTSYASGHTHGGSDGIGKGQGFLASYEQERLGMGFGLMYALHRVERHYDDGKLTKTVDSHVLAMYLRPKWKATKEIHPYVLAGGGMDFTETQSNPVAILGVGVDYWITNSIALSPNCYVLTEEKRNYRAIGLSLRYEF